MLKEQINMMSSRMEDQRGRIMDIADQAQFLIDERTERATQAVRARTTLSLPFSGSCLCCGDPVEQRRFCDADCRADYDKKLRRKAGLGPDPRAATPALPAPAKTLALPSPYSFPST